MPNARVFMMVTVSVAITDQDGKETHCQGSSSNSLNGDEYPDVAVIRQLVQGHMAAAENVSIKQVARLYAEKELATIPLPRLMTVWSGPVLEPLPKGLFDKLQVIDDEEATDGDF